MISKENLRQKLLDTDLFIDNISFDQYVDMIYKNLYNFSQKDLTQKHHIIPRYYFQHRKLPIDNSRDNLINISVADHIRAHYYLSKCSKSEDEQYSNLYALRRMLGGQFTNLKDIENLDDEQIKKLYQEYNQGNRNAHLGTTHITSDETKAKISKANSGKYHDYITVHDGDIEKRLPPDEAQHYLDGGWELGRSDKAKDALSKGYNYNSKGMLGKHQTENQKQAASQALLGVPKSDDARHNMSIARLEKILYHNPATGESKYLSKDEINEYEKLGWIKGRK